MGNFDTKLETITGVGKTLAAVIFSEIGGDIKKFSSVPKLVAYAGLYPKSRQSGESKTEGRSLSAVLLTCVELFGLPPPSLLSKIRLSVSFIRRNAPQEKII